MPADSQHRAIVLRGNIRADELMRLLKLVREMHDERPDTAHFEILVVDEEATMRDSKALLEENLPGFSFRCYPFPAEAG